MESVEDEKGKRNPGDDSPGQESKELGLYSLCDVSVSHEGVKDPKSYVGEQHEGDDLSSRFCLLLCPGGTYPS